MFSNPFRKKGIWLKGNLHGHTTNSDGRLTPQEYIDFYYKSGYGFLAITDHEKITRISSDKVVMITGIETGTGRGENGHSYHVVLIDVYDNNEIQRRRKNSIYELFDWVKANKVIAFIAHPYWSSLTVNDLRSIDGYLGIELYNTGCDIECGKGYSTVHWDNLLASGREVSGIAVDDAHRYFIPPIDAPGGWVTVKTETRTKEDILKALREGSFYASTGPIFYNFESANNVIKADFSHVKRVDFISEGGAGFTITNDMLDLIKYGDKYRKYLSGMFKEFLENIEISREDDRETFYGNVRRRKVEVVRDGSGITSVRLEGYIFRKYFRLEITDKNERKAWLNPVFY